MDAHIKLVVQLACAKAKADKSRSATFTASV